LTSQTITD